MWPIFFCMYELLSHYAKTDALIRYVYIRHSLFLDVSHSLQLYFHLYSSSLLLNFSVSSTILFLLISWKILVHRWYFSCPLMKYFPLRYYMCKSICFIHSSPLLALFPLCNPQTLKSCPILFLFFLLSPLPEHCKIKLKYSSYTKSPSPAYSHQWRPSQRYGAEGRAPVWSSFLGTAPPSGPGPHPAAAAHSRCGPWSCCGESCCLRWQSLCGEVKNSGVKSTVCFWFLQRHPWESQRKTCVFFTFVFQSKLFLVIHYGLNSKTYLTLSRETVFVLHDMF